MRDKCQSCGVSDRYHGTECDKDAVRRHKANVRRRANRAAMTAVLDSVGMVRVRGGLGGGYIE